MDRLIQIQMTQFILALCGLPASGKSRLADAIQEAMSSDIEIVRTDDWRDEVYYTNWEPEKERPVREASLEKVVELVSRGRSVIHDDTNYYTSMRHELFEIAVKNNLGFAVIHVSTPLAIALRWNRSRTDSVVPDHVIEDIDRRFDNPGKRYLWDNSILDVDMNGADLKRVIPDVIEVLKNLEAVQSLKAKTISNTEFNEIDTVTRKIVSEFLRKHPELRGNPDVSTVRRRILRTVNQQNLSIEKISEILIEQLSGLL